MQHPSPFLVVPKCPLAAHLAAIRTLQNLQQTYYWPGMSKEVAAWCKQCAKCATSKGPPTKHRSHLQKLVTGAHLDIVAVDILSGVSVTSKEHHSVAR